MGSCAMRSGLILDRDTKFTEQFRRIPDEAGVGVVTTAFQARDR
jgi:hypothetical protein